MLNRHGGKMKLKGDQNKSRNLRILATAASAFMFFVTIGSLGETLLAGIQGIETTLSLYKLITGWFIGVLAPIFSLVRLPQPNRETIDFIILANISFRSLILGRTNIPLSFRVAVIVIASFSIFMISYSLEFFETGSKIIANILVFLGIYHLGGAFTVLANQRLFSEGLSLDFRKRILWSKQTYESPAPGLFLRNLFLWPVMWFNYDNKSRRNVFGRWWYGIVVVASITIFGLLVRAIDDHADVTLPTAERWTTAIDGFLEDL